MTITTIAYLEQSVRTVFKSKDDLADAQACLSESGIPAIISCLDVACSCSFSALANLRNDPPPQAVAISIGDEIAASGGETPDDIYLKKKVGNEDLTTLAKDLSGAVNELVDSINIITGTDTTLPAAMTALTAKVDGVSTASDSVAGIIGDVPLTTTAQTLSGGITELDGEIGVLTSLDTTEKGTIVGAINELAASGGGGGAATYTPVGTLKSFYAVDDFGTLALIATGSTNLASHMQA